MKKHPSLDEDLELLKTTIKAYFPKKHPSKTKIVHVPPSHVKVDVDIYKVRQFRCRTFQGKGSNSGLRIIYAVIENDVFFVEIYKKSKHKKMDNKRVQRYFESMKPRS